MKGLLIDLILGVIIVVVVSELVLPKDASLLISIIVFVPIGFFIPSFRKWVLRRIKC